MYTWINKLIHIYLRNFPIDKGKDAIEKWVSLPQKCCGYEGGLGVKYDLNLTDHVMRTIYLRGIFEKNTIRHILPIIEDDMVFVDVGANVGAYSLIVGKKLINGRVLSFEPNPRTRKYLKQNISLNSLDNIEIIEKGLSNKIEDAVLYTPSLSTASINKHHESSEQEAIELITLDSFCQDRGIEEINILKIDTEGHEVKCIEGAVDIISKSEKLIFIVEIDNNCLHSGYTRESLFEMILSMGFSAYLPK